MYVIIVEAILLIHNHPPVPLSGGHVCTQALFTGLVKWVIFL